MPINQMSNIKKSICRSEQLFCDKRPIRLIFPTVSSTNCYAYSLGIMYPKEEEQHLYFPGFTEDLRYERGNIEDLMDKIELDLKNLEIAFRRFALEDKKTLRKNEYLIKVFYDDSKYEDFHFVRQDKYTGMWFHKIGWYNQPELVYPTPEKEPTIFRIDHHVYNPVGYFAIAEGKS